MADVIEWLKYWYRGLVDYNDKEKEEVKEKIEKKKRKKEKKKKKKEKQLCLYRKRNWWLM